MKRSKKFFVVMAVLLALGLTAYAALYGWIQMTAHQKVDAVRAAYPQANSDAEALIRQIQNESESMQMRNTAVWIAGRLRVKEALPVMKSHYSAQDCEHESNLCQHELEKAIKRCGGKI